MFEKKERKKKANIKVLVKAKQTKSVKYFSWIQLKFKIWLPAPFSPMWLAIEKQDEPDQTKAYQATQLPANAIDWHRSGLRATDICMTR